MASTPPTLSQNRIVTPILLGTALLLGIFLLKPTYAAYIEKKAIISTLSQDASKLQSEYLSLKSIKDNIGSVVSPEKLNRIQKLAKKYDNSDIISAIMLSDYTKDTQAKLAPIVISSIAVNK
jgi:flagellar biosynthesis protein FliP